MTPTRQAWLRASLGAGAVAAEVGAALVAGSGLGSASADDGGGGGGGRGAVIAGQDLDSGAPARSRGPAKARLGIRHPRGPGHRAPLVRLTPGVHL